MITYWKKNGLLVKIINADGINMVIYDENVVQVAIKKNDKRKEKFGFVLQNRY